MQNLFTFFENYVPLSEISKEMIRSAVEIVKFKKNKIIINEGAQNNFMYIIKKGIVKGYYLKQGEYKVVSFWMENDTFGDVLTYITGEPASKTYVAIENVEAYQIDIKKFRALFEQNHEICNLGRLLVERFIVKSECFKNIFRDKSAEEKISILLKYRPEIYKRCKLKDIASFLNICPETLSRLRNKSCNASL